MCHLRCSEEQPCLDPPVREGPQPRFTSVGQMPCKVCGSREDKAKFKYSILYPAYTHFTHIFYPGINTVRMLINNNLTRNKGHSPEYAG